MNKAYSLLEVLMVVTILLVLLGGGAVSYRRYTASRTNVQDAGVFADVLTQAREKTLARDLGNTTNCATFTGYRVQVVPSTSSYSLYRLCTGQTIPALATYQLKDSRIVGNAPITIDFVYPYGTLGSNQAVSFQSNSTSGCQTVHVSTTGIITERPC